MHANIKELIKIGFHVLILTKIKLALDIFNQQLIHKILI